MTSDMTADEMPFAEDAAADRGGAEPTLIVDVGGFEGPLDLLLTMARQQKVDLAKISILALANQYLAFIEQARSTRLELAADYLVMAAWLAYLKSRMLLPEPVAPEGMSAADMANALALRLKRLDAIREAGVRLVERPLLGRLCGGAGAAPHRARLLARGDPRVGARRCLGNSSVGRIRPHLSAQAGRWQWRRAGSRHGFASGAGVVTWS